MTQVTFNGTKYNCDQGVISLELPVEKIRNSPGNRQSRVFENERFNAECGICLEPLKEAFKINCGSTHTERVHETCIRKILTGNGDTSCPFCKKRISRHPRYQDDFIVSGKVKEFFRNFVTVGDDIYPIHCKECKKPLTGDVVALECEDETHDRFHRACAGRFFRNGIDANGMQFHGHTVRSLRLTPDAALAEKINAHIKEHQDLFPRESHYSQQSRWPFTAPPLSSHQQNMPALISPRERPHVDPVDLPPPVHRPQANNVDLYVAWGAILFSLSAIAYTINALYFAGASLFLTVVGFPASLVIIPLAALLRLITAAFSTAAPAAAATV